LPQFLFEGNERHLKIKKYLSALYHFSPLYPTMEQILFHCNSQMRKTSSTVSYNGGKPLPLWDTTEENLWGLWDTMCGRFFCIESLNVKKFRCSILFFCVLFSTRKMLLSSMGYSTEKASVLWDTVHCIRFCCGVGYNGRKTPALWRYNGKKKLTLYPTKEEKLLHCGVQ
jgi:hypothetical protein